VIVEAGRLDPPPPVVVLTGRIEEDLTDDLRRAGAAACLRKPVDIKQLLAAIAEAIGE
jgi:CheY-like chemotaxis protein